MNNLLQYPIATEKALNMAERGNTIIYVVNFNAAKKDIKKEFEDTFKVKVERVNTVIMPENVKRAYIKLKKEYLAGDIAKRLKLV
ncbi:MAG: 50S ribosomal protein L23 [Candidatus Marsarchaeota archaeon]|nr:50S ribosomal protein L23 [Candidatus Marsarchaeota archaeon]